MKYEEEGDEEDEEEGKEHLHKTCPAQYREYCEGMARIHKVRS